MSHIIYVCYQASPTIWRQSEATLCLTFYYPNVIFCWAFTLCVLHQTFLQLLLVTEVILKDLLDALNNTPFNSWVCFYKPFMARALAGSRPVFIQRQRLRSEQSGAQAKIAQCKLNCGIPDGGWVPVWTIRVCKYQSRTDRSHCFSSPLLSFLSRFFSTFCSSLHLCHFIVIHCCHVSRSTCPNSCFHFLSSLSSTAPSCCLPFICSALIQFFHLLSFSSFPPSSFLSLLLLSLS